MKSVDLNANWNVYAFDGTYVCDLPHDVTASCARDYACAFGSNNGYIPAAKATFTHVLPNIAGGKCKLVISGACGYGNVSVNGTIVGKLDGYAPKTIELSGLDGTQNVIAIELFTSPAMSDKYLGLGIAGGVKLITFDDVDISYGSLFVKTVVVNDRTYADTELEVFNNGNEPQKLVLECTAFNARGKRAGKKQRKLYIRAGRAKTVNLRVRINNPYEWSPSDPYKYAMTAKLILQDGSERVANTNFGIVTRMLSQLRGLYLNGHRVKLFGAYMAHNDVAIGSDSIYINEKRKLTALKSVGYNAVHFVECPTDATLDACDDVGLYAYIDLASRLTANKNPLDGVFAAEPNAREIVAALRNHPCVTVYGVADDVAECYDRNDGHALIARIAAEIRETDGTRPVTVSARELVPMPSELESAGCRKCVFDNDAAAINAGREKHLFEELTRGAFRAVDICGLDYLYPLYDSERFKREKPIIGSRSSNEKAFESLDAADKSDRIVGDFSDCGMDYAGGGKLNEIIRTDGDIDAIGCLKPQAVYKKILLGTRGIAYIVPFDPDTDEPTHMWNFPRYLGKKIAVKVYTSGDVVALYRDGKLVGRKLAGKVNKHIATFDVDFYPGTLEAVAYFKGIECARTVLRSAGSPKTIRLTAFDKSLYISRGDIGFVTVEVCDKDGEPVPYAMRTLDCTVTGGELLGFINADPMLRKPAFDECPAYGGKALAVIRPDPAEIKTVVKITGEGLLASRISFKIKN